MQPHKNELRVGRSSIRIAPSPTGLSLLGAVIMVLVLSQARLVAIGFFVPLLAAGALDAILSYRELARRPISMTPVLTVVSSPDTVRFRVQAPPGRHRVQLFLKALSKLEPDLMPVTLPADGTSIEVEVVDGMVTYQRHARCRVSMSIFGLCWARRWETHETTPILRGPAAVELDALDMPSSGDLDRLRPYTPGDRMNRVAWGATARTGDLHVRSVGAGEEEMTVIVNLGTDLSLVSSSRSIADPRTGKSLRPLPMAQVGLEHARSVVSSLLDQGYIVRLITRDVSQKFYDYKTDHYLANPRKGMGRPLVFDENGDGWLNGELITQLSDGLVFDSDSLIRRLAKTDHGRPIEAPPGPYVEVTPFGVNFVQH